MRRGKWPETKGESSENGERKIEIRELVRRKNNRNQGQWLTQEVEAGTSGVQSQHELHSEF